MQYILTLQVLLMLNPYEQFLCFHFSNLKSSSVNAINNLSSVSIYIGFNHSKSSLLSLSEVLSSENISIVHQFKLARVNCNGGTDVEFRVLELSSVRALQEHSFVSQVELNMKSKKYLCLTISIVLSLG